MNATPETPIVSIEDKMAICRMIPSEDWERFQGKKHLAVSIGEMRILDADDDLGELVDRIDAAYPPDYYFTAPGQPAKKARRAR